MPILSCISPEPELLGRGHRLKRKPKQADGKIETPPAKVRRRHDVLPSGHAQLPPGVPLPSIQATSLDSSAPAGASPPAISAPNVFGLTRHFLGREFPSHDPEEIVEFEDIIDRQNADVTPFSNLSSFMLAEWRYQNGQSKGSLETLARTIAGEGFRPEDLKGTN